MKKNIDIDLEALRGFCALTVVVHHMILFSFWFCPGFYFEKVIGYNPPGNLMVLIFFVLSGYVIAYSNKAGLSLFSVPDYLKKRFVRIYPIYLIGIAFAVLVGYDKWNMVVMNCFFLQNILCGPLNYDVALWSLNHEVVYYLLAIPFLYFREPLYIIPILFFALLFSLLFYPFPSIIEAYLVGFIFWLSGFFLCRLKTRKNKGGQNSESLGINKLIPLFLLLLASGDLNILNNIFESIQLITKHRIPTIGSSALVSFVQFKSYLLCIYAIMVAIKLKYRFFWAFEIIIYLNSWFALFGIIKSGMYFQNSTYIVSSIFLAISTLLILFPSFNKLKNSFWVYIGSISYCVYIIHFPLFFMLGKVSIYAGNFKYFVVRSILLFFFLIVISHILEKVMQPRIKDFFFKVKNM